MSKPPKPQIPRGLTQRLVQGVRKKMRQYREEEHFRFLGSSVAKMILFYSVVVVGIILIEKFLLDFDQVFNRIFEQLSDGEILVTLLISESIIGLLPPEVFMVWVSTLNRPVIMLCLLGAVAYLGGVIAYQTGSWIGKRPKIKAYVEKKLEKTIALVQKWGGAFIILAALFPFTPYATVVVAVSLLKYPFHRFLLFGIFRIVRFIAQGILLVEVIDING